MNFAKNCFRWKTQVCVCKKWIIMKAKQYVRLLTLSRTKSQTTFYQLFISSACGCLIKRVLRENSEAFVRKRKPNVRIISWKEFQSLAKRFLYQMMRLLSVIIITFWLGLIDWLNSISHQIKQNKDVSINSVSNGEKGNANYPHGRRDDSGFFLSKYHEFGKTMDHLALTMYVTVLMRGKRKL